MPTKTPRIVFVSLTYILDGFLKVLLQILLSAVRGRDSLVSDAKGVEVLRHMRSHVEDITDVESLETSQVLGVTFVTWKRPIGGVE